MILNRIIYILCTLVFFYYSEAMEKQCPPEHRESCCVSVMPLTAPVKIQPRQRINGLIEEVLADSLMLPQTDKYYTIINELSSTLINSIRSEGKLFSTLMRFKRACRYHDFSNMQETGKMERLFTASCFIDDRKPLTFLNFLIDHLDRRRAQYSTFDSTGKEVAFTDERTHATSVATERKLVIVSYPLKSPIPAGVKLRYKRSCSFYNAEEVRFFVRKKGCDELNVTMYPSQWSLTKKRLMRF